MVQFAYATHNADSHHRLLFDSRTTMKLNFVLRVFLLAAGTFHSLDGWMDVRGQPIPIPPLLRHGTFQLNSIDLIANRSEEMVPAAISN